MKNLRKHIILVALQVAGFICYLNVMCAQVQITGSDDLLILDEQIRIDSGAGMTIYGNLTAETKSKIINNGAFTFSTDNEYKELYNNSSEEVFDGEGYYVFEGNSEHYLGGNYNTHFNNISLNKGIAKALVVEVPTIQVNKILELKSGILDVGENLALIENADSNAVSTRFLNIYSFINGRLKRKVNYGTFYHFPVSQSRIIRSLILQNNFEEVEYLDVLFTDGDQVDLTSKIGLQYGISYFKGLDRTGVWEINSDVENPEGSMNLEAYIANFNSYSSLDDNMFGLLQSEEIDTETANWDLEGEMEYYDSPYRKVGTLTTKVRNAQELGYYALGIAERQKFVNLIAPGRGRETRFIIKGLEVNDPENSQYDNENCELVVYNIFGQEVWRKKPYENDMDMQDFKDGTYYYEFKFTIDGKPGAIQSYIDVKRID